MALTLATLKKIMRQDLEALNKKKGIAKGAITDETVIGDVVTDKDGYVTSNTMNIFRGAIGLTIYNNLDKKKTRWPVDWPKWKVGELAERLLAMMIFLFISITSFAQLEVSLGTVKTPGNNTALDLGLKWATNLDSIWSNQDMYKYGKNSSFNISPSIDIQTGTMDAFNSINVKAVGLFSVFKMQQIDEAITPNLDKTVNTFPFSIGAEADNTFKKINGIVEIGWVPWYQSETRNLPDFIKRTKFGVFVQGGHKFYKDTTDTKTIGRARGNFNIDTKKLITIQGLSLGLVGDADGWYDFVNGKTYYKLEGRARVYLSDDLFTDFLIQEGSGAPNFFTGTQYGVGLTILF